MGGTILNLRTMLQQYEKQLLAARRLARYRRAARLANGEDPPMDPEVKRRATVERVARELYERLLFTGSDSPVVEEIRGSLGRAVGSTVRFTYPPGAEEMRLVREGPEGKRTVTGQEQAQALEKLWDITVDAVDKSML